MSIWSERQQQRYADDMARDNRTEYFVSCPHPSGQNVAEYGVNTWRTESLEEAKQLASSHDDSKINRKRTRYTIPKAKRRPRQFTVWDEVTQ